MAKIIMGVKVDHRHDDASQVQELLTEYGCIIKTRLGLHKASDDRTVCNEDGLILLEFIMDADKEAGALESKLEALVRPNLINSILHRPLSPIYFVSQA